MGHKIAVLPKADLSQLDVTAAFHEKAPSISVFPLNSPHSFVTKNVYHTADRERRTSTVDSLIAPYTTDEVPVDQIDAAIWHLAGLAGGDIPNEMIPFAAKHAMVAIDVQTMLRWVENGEDALAAAVEYRPDLILLDAMMPKISGFDVLDILKNTPETMNIGIIMLTALSQEKDKQRAEALGVDEYLVKSQVVISDVVERVRHHLGLDA
jgi:CheY-like chemotaxis protein